ncbi:MAG: aminotransferase class V-fold PLP-dependent enzyme [Victivallales bacterium]|nr:aminotransferase class V-fold PLP-dependent enzyme [Victivallales bacterium]
MTSQSSTLPGGAPVKAGAPPVFFDEAASALPHPRLAEWFARLCGEIPYNPHGGTKYAEISRRRILLAEERILRILGADNAFIIWTSGVTEALNLALNSLGKLTLNEGSHPALAEPAALLPKPENQTRNSFASSHVESETGRVRDLVALRKEIGNDLLLVDGAQSFCKIDIPWRSASIDMLALSSRKIGGPASIGALVVKKGIAIKPLMFGGGQQNGLRPGTLDAIGISLFAEVACDRAAHQAENYRKITALNQQLWSMLNESGLRYVRISPDNAYPGIAMFALPGYEGAVIVRILAEKEGILLSSGTACTAETGRPSANMIHAAGSEEMARSAIRVSLSHTNTTAEIQQLVTALKRTLQNY